jgi:hypothetical protein
MITINKKKCNSDKDCNDNMLCAFNDEDLNSYCVDNDLTHMYAGCLNNNKNDFETTISKVTDNIDYTNCIDFARRQINKDGIEYNYMIYRPKKKVFVDTTTINIYLKCGNAVLAVLPYDDYFYLSCDENQENCTLKNKSSLINFIKSNIQNCNENIYLEITYQCENEGINKTNKIPIDINNNDIIINLNCPINIDDEKYKPKCEALFINDYNNNNLNNNIDIEKSLYDCKNPLYKVPRLVSNIDNHKKLKTNYTKNEIKNYDEKINEKLEDLKRLEAEKYIKLTKIQTGKNITITQAMNVINKNFSNNGVIGNNINNNWKIYKNYDAAQNLFNINENDVKILNYFGKVYTLQEAIIAANKNYQNFFVWYHNSFELSDYASKLFFIDIYSSNEDIINKSNWVKNDNVTTAILKLQFEHFDNDDDDYNYDDDDDDGIYVNNIDDIEDNNKLKEIFDISCKNNILQEDIEELLNSYMKYDNKLSVNTIHDLNDKITTYGQAILLNNYETDVNNKILMYLSIGLFFMFLIFIIVLAYFNNISAGKIKLFGR